MPKKYIECVQNIFYTFKIEGNIFYVYNSFFVQADKLRQKCMCILKLRLPCSRSMILGLTIDISNVLISYDCPAQHYKSTTLFWF